MLTMHWQSLDVFISEEKPATLAKAASSSSEDGQEIDPMETSTEGSQSKVAGVKNHLAGTGKGIIKSRGKYIQIFKLKS